MPSWIADLAKLTGTVYFGNQPWTLAIGQLSDQRSWLGITVSSDLLALKLKFRIALGLQIVDGGPKGFGVVTSFTGGDNWGIGKFQVYGSLGFLWGAWKTGSDTSAVHLWAQFGFKMSVFYVFSVGHGNRRRPDLPEPPRYWLVLRADPHRHPVVPARRLIPFQQAVGATSQPFDSPLLNPPLSGGDAGSPAAASSAVPCTCLPLSDGNTDPNDAVLVQRARPGHGRRRSTGVRAAATT